MRKTARLRRPRYRSLGPNQNSPVQALDNIVTSLVNACALDRGQRYGKTLTVLSISAPQAAQENVMAKAATDARSREKKVYDLIHRAIAERRLLPGTKLNEDALADVFNVSRARIRRVLLLLAKDDVVKLEPNRGAFVWRPSVQDARNVLHARRVIEFELVREAALKASKPQIKHLRQIVAEEELAIKNSDYALSIRLSGDFHIALAFCANNPILTEVLANLISRSYLILATYQKRDAQVCPNLDHQRIVDLIEARDAEGALEAQRRHFEHIEHELDLSEKATSLNLKEIFLGAV